MKSNKINLILILILTSCIVAIIIYIIHNRRNKILHSNNPLSIKKINSIQTTIDTTSKTENTIPIIKNEDSISIIELNSNLIIKN